MNDMIKAEIITHKNKWYFHLWLIPSLEVDYEDFKSEKYGHHKWTHITLSWLVWSVDIEIIKDYDTEDKASNRD